MLCDVGELAARLAGSTDVRSFLDQITAMVADHLDSDVCSIYLFEESTRELVRRATRGLTPTSVGQVRMSIDEGLTGRTLRELRPIRETHASGNPHFKHFEGINEEPYEAFLGVPIRKGVERIGVLVVQREQSRAFSPRDEMALRATASQLASAIENARMLMGFESLAKQPLRKDQEELPVLVRGRVASKGWAMGPAVVQDPARRHGMLTEARFDRTYTLDDFHRALDATARQLHDLQASLQQRLPDVAALIFDVHLMMLKDPTLVDEMVSRIEAGGNPPQVAVAVGRKYMDLLAASTHIYMRDKANDVKDLINRVVANLIGAVDDLPLGGGNVVIAPDLYPSDVLKLSSAGTLGVVLVNGGVTSHVSILARSLRMPVLIAEEPRLLDLPARTSVLLDGETGNVYLNPSPDVIERFEARRAAEVRLESLGPKMRPTTSTRDGTRVRLLANINLLSDVDLARQARAEGVGLYRSEFPFLIRSAPPSEEEQYVIYKHLIDGMDGREVTFRTLDIGGDKLVAYYADSREENPAMGLRSIRFSFRHRDVFTQQLRAILRAGAGGAPLRIMFPMIASLDDFLEAKRIVGECAGSLRAEGTACHEAPSLGVMVEVPAAAEITDTLAKHADFLCIGTNDLIQFLLAVDRTNEKVASYFVPHHPAVLRPLARIAEAGARHGREVSVCGEMAHEQAYVPLLLGLGIRALSLDPQYLPTIQECIGAIAIDEAREHARELVACDTVQDVARHLGLAVP